MNSHWYWTQQKNIPTENTHIHKTSKWIEQVEESFIHHCTTAATWWIMEPDLIKKNLNVVYGCSGLTELGSRRRVSRYSEETCTLRARQRFIAMLWFYFRSFPFPAYRTLFGGLDACMLSAFWDECTDLKKIFFLDQWVNDAARSALAVGIACVVRVSCPVRSTFKHDHKQSVEQRGCDKTHWVRGGAAPEIVTKVLWQRLRLLFFH